MKDICFCQMKVKNGLLSEFREKKQITMGQPHHSSRMLTASSRVDEIIKVCWVITKMWWWAIRKCSRHNEIVDLNRVEASHKCIVKEV